MLLNELRKSPGTLLDCVRKLARQGESESPASSVRGASMALARSGSRAVARDRKESHA